MHSWMQFLSAYIYIIDCHFNPKALLGIYKKTLDGIIRAVSYWNGLNYWKFKHAASFLIWKSSSSE